MRIFCGTFGWSGCGHLSFGGGPLLRNIGGGTRIPLKRSTMRPSYGNSRKESFRHRRPLAFFTPSVRTYPTRPRRTLWVLTWKFVMARPPRRPVAAVKGLWNLGAQFQRYIPARGYFLARSIPSGAT